MTWPIIYSYFSPPLVATKFIHQSCVQIPCAFLLMKNFMFQFFNILYMVVVCDCHNRNYRQAIGVRVQHNIHIYIFCWYAFQFGLIRYCVCIGYACFVYIASMLHCVFAYRRFSIFLFLHHTRLEMKSFFLFFFRTLRVLHVLLHALSSIYIVCNSFL